MFPGLPLPLFFYFFIRVRGELGDEAKVASCVAEAFSTNCAARKFVLSFVGKTNTHTYTHTHNNNKNTHTHKSSGIKIPHAKEK